MSFAKRGFRPTDTAIMLWILAARDSAFVVCATGRYRAIDPNGWPITPWRPLPRA